MQNRGLENISISVTGPDSPFDSFKEVFGSETKSKSHLFATPDRKIKGGFSSHKKTHLSAAPFYSSNQPFSPSPIRDVISDRFIPVRSGPVSRNLFEVSDEISNPPNRIEPFSDEAQRQVKYTSLLENQLLNFKNEPLSSKLSKSRSSFGSATPDTKASRDSGHLSKQKLLKFKTPLRDDKYSIPSFALSPFMELEEEEELVIQDNKPQRKISKTPYKILDAPGLADDFYIDLLHWSQKNFLAVSLLHSVWSLNVETDEVNKLFEDTESDTETTSVQWDEKGTTLALGDSDGYLNLWDFTSAKKLRSIKGHLDRINCISWHSTHVVSTASRDGTILTSDLRMTNSSVIRHSAHRDEVCGLKWSPSGRHLASGGNDNKVYIWNLHKSEPQARFDQHTSAVKAISWSPHQQELLLTGGGYTDRKINIWNVLSSNLVNSIETDSQVCNILFSKNSNEFVTTHGHPKNQVVVWKYPDLSKLCVLDSTQSHSQRILYLSDSPNGEDIVTGASDETLKFWNVFAKKPNKSESNLFPSSWDLR